MDGYSMPIADMLVDAAAGHKVISFMDGNAGYNQNFMAEEDSKDRFQVPRRNRSIRVGCDDLWSKNAGATYQRVMNYIFHKLIGRIVEIYIDDVMLGFMVHERGIEVGQKSVKAIDEAVPLTTKIELQSLLSKINFIRRFISNLSERILPFSPLLKLKNDQEFK